jgi:AraC family transcriptional regulator
MHSGVVGCSNRGFPAERLFPINVTAVERILHRSPVLAVGEYRCPVLHPQFAGGGPQTCPYIVFSRSSVRIVPLDGKPETRTPNTLGLYNVGDVYARQAVSEEGDRCDWIAIDPAVLRDIGRCVDPALEDDRKKIFATASAPTKASLYLAQRALFQSLRDDPHMSMLEVEERALRIVEAALDSAMSFAPTRRTRGRKPGVAGVRAAVIVDAARSVLARDFASPLSIGLIASRVHCSPGYLSRLFRSATGFSLHDYQQQLRLRASLDLLADARSDLSAIAAYLGYANHSHFTSTFRRQFGITPIQFVRRCSLKQLRELEICLGQSGRTATHRTTPARAVLSTK